MGEFCQFLLVLVRFVQVFLSELPALFRRKLPQQAAEDKFSDSFFCSRHKERVMVLAI